MEISRGIAHPRTSLRRRLRVKISLFDSGIEWRTAALDAILSDMTEAAGGALNPLHLCLSGGSTPKPVYESLATNEEFLLILEKRTVELWIGDERDVPADSPYRNGAMVADAFKNAFEASRARTGPGRLVLNLWPALPAEESCRLYASTIEAKMGERGAFCCTILGIGNDGHTASLFSATDADKDDGTLAFPTLAPDFPQRRMTMSAPLLRRTNHILLLAKGAGKTEILEKVSRGGGTYPISRFDGDKLHALYCSGKDCV